MFFVKSNLIGDKLNKIFNRITQTNKEKNLLILYRFVPYLVVRKFDFIFEST
jgi:hypothetical protein